MSVFPSSGLGSGKWFVVIYSCLSFRLLAAGEQIEGGEKQVLDLFKRTIPDNVESGGSSIEWPRDIVKSSTIRE